METATMDDNNFFIINILLSKKYISTGSFVRTTNFLSKTELLFFKFTEKCSDKGRF